MDRSVHHDSLVSQGRCGRCAERVRRAAILVGDDCDRCGASLQMSGGQMVDELADRHRRWRWKGYGLIGVGSFLAGFVPLLQVVVQVVGLLVLHVVVLRRGLEWLPVGRRILARMTMKLLGAVIALAAVVVNVVVAPFVGAAAVVLAVAGPLLTAVYVEGSLAVLRRRLRWQARGEPVRWGEWIVPLVMVALLVGVVTLTVALVAGAVQFVASLEVPAIDEISSFLLEWLE